MRRASIASVIGAMGLVVAPLVARGATPADGVLVPGKTVSWSGGPMSGSAPVQRNATCGSGINCDDFALDIKVPANTYRGGAKPMVVIALTTQANQDIRLIISEPGADNSLRSTDYAVYGPTAKLVSPKQGTWRIRAACYTCANATYTAVAKVVPFTQPVLEPQGLFTWKAGLLPGAGQGEPAINADSKGTLWVNAPVGNVTVWRSDDDAKTWTVNSNVDSTGAGSGDSDLSIAPDDGTVYVMNLNPVTFANDVFVSTDQGKTYTGPSIVGVGSDRPWIWAGTKGVVYGAYHDLLGANQIWVYRSDDHGKTFTHLSNVNLGQRSWENTVACGTGIAHPMVDPHDNNTVYFLYVTGDDPAQCEETLPNAQDFPVRQVWMARSTDGGQTFTQTLVYTSKTSVGHFWPADAIDRAGNVYAVTAETGPKGPGEEGLSTHVLMFASRDKGRTWSKPLRVDALADHHSNVFPAIAGGDAGHVALAWYTSRATSWFDTTATWTVAYAQTQDAFAPTPRFQQSRATGIVHVGDVCQSGLFCVFGGNRNLLDFMGVAIGPDGQSSIAYATDLTGSVVDGVSRQLSGLSGNATTRQSSKGKPGVLGSHTSRGNGKLPSTGTDAPVLGVALMLVALGIVRRARA